MQKSECRNLSLNVRTLIAVSVKLYGQYGQREWLQYNTQHYTLFKCLPNRSRITSALEGIHNKQSGSSLNLIRCFKRSRVSVYVRRHAHILKNEEVESEVRRVGMKGRREWSELKMKWKYIIRRSSNVWTVQYMRWEVRCGARLF